MPQTLFLIDKTPPYVLGALAFEVDGAGELVIDWITNTAIMPSYKAEAPLDHASLGLVSNTLMFRGADTDTLSCLDALTALEPWDVAWCAADLAGPTANVLRIQGGHPNVGTTLNFNSANYTITRVTSVSVDPNVVPTYDVQVNPAIPCIGGLACNGFPVNLSRLDTYGTDQPTPPFTVLTFNDTANTKTIGQLVFGGSQLTRSAVIQFQTYKPAYQMQFGVNGDTFDMSMPLVQTRLTTNRDPALVPMLALDSAVIVESIVGNKVVCRGGVPRPGLFLMGAGSKFRVTGVTLKPLVLGEPIKTEVLFDTVPSLTAGDVAMITDWRG